MSVIKKINVNGTEYSIGGGTNVHYLLYNGSKLTENDAEKTHIEVHRLISTLVDIVYVVDLTSTGGSLVYSLSTINSDNDPIYFEAVDKDSKVNVLKLNTNNTVEITSKEFLTLDTLPKYGGEVV